MARDLLEAKPAGRVEMIPEVQRPVAAFAREAAAAAQLDSADVAVVDADGGWGPPDLIRRMFKGRQAPVAENGLKHRADGGASPVQVVLRAGAGYSRIGVARNAALPSFT